jgi:soluble lytic murein transglycosylase
MRKVRLQTSWILACSIFSVAVVGQENTEELTLREQQRAVFLTARAALNSDENAAYQALLGTLDDYPLRLYLEYAGVSTRLSLIANAENSTAEVDDFLRSYTGTYLALRLERSWVRELALQERWPDVQRYHNPSNTTVELTCYALHARLLGGDKSAFNEVATLWNVSRSQVNNCDPVFEAWIDDGQLTPEITWQRFSKTIQAGRNALARYVSTLMPEQERELAELYLRVDHNPHLLENRAEFSTRTPEMIEIVQYGLRQLAVSDASLAWSLIADYQALLNFPLEDLVSLQSYTVQRLILSDELENAEAVLLENPELITESFVSQIVRDALKDLDWYRVSEWINRLTQEQRDTDRWQYWQAKVLTHEGNVEALIEAHNLLMLASQNRSYFGFLAANQLDVEYEFADQPVLVSQAQIQEVSEIPSIERAYELYLIGDEPNALNEWNFASAQMAEAQIMASGRLAESWGWHRNSIQAMIRAQYWNDLELRFPLAYVEIFNSSAAEFSLPSHLLYAIARQESALMHDVRSSAGALGLMQLMPATGLEMAARTGQRVSRQDLLNPELNIKLGSRYFSQLLHDFDDNRILAMAAYNAGPNRVKQWLQRSQSRRLPFDVWVETIPYGETRNYVESVLTYTVIYGHRTGVRLALFTDEELGALL